MKHLFFEIPTMGEGMDAFTIIEFPPVAFALPATSPILS